MKRILAIRVLLSLFFSAFFCWSELSEPGLYAQDLAQSGPSDVGRPAQKIAYYFGGGGEPAAWSDTNFDPDFIQISAKLREAGYQSSVYFNGGHPASDALAAKTWAGKAKPFTAKNFAQALSDLKAKIPSMQKGDQILIVVDSHGLSGAPGSSAGSPDAKKRLHEVWAGSSIEKDGETTGLEKVDLAQLEPLAAQIERKTGVKLAVIDLSCFSANTIQLTQKAPSACVVASSNATSPGQLNFGAGLTSALQAGRSLQDAFLEARSGQALGAPQISGPRGQTVYETIGAIENRLIGDPDWVQRLYRNPNPNVCLTPPLRKEAQGMVQFLDLVASPMQGARVSTPKVRKLETELARYFDWLDEIEKAVRVTRQEFMGQRTPLPSGKSVTVEEIAMIDPVWSRADRLAYMKGRTFTPEQSQRHREYLDVILPEMLAEQQRRMSDPAFAEVVRAERLLRQLRNDEPVDPSPDLVVDSSGTRKSAARRTTDRINPDSEFSKRVRPVVAAERAVYDELYETASREKGGKQKAEPCADFKF